MSENPALCCILVQQDMVRADLTRKDLIEHQPVNYSVTPGWQLLWCKIGARRSTPLLQTTGEAWSWIFISMSVLTDTKPTFFCWNLNPRFLGSIVYSLKQLLLFVHCEKVRNIPQTTSKLITILMYIFYLQRLEVETLGEVILHWPFVLWGTFIFLKNSSHTFNLFRFRLFWRSLLLHCLLPCLC